jgi:hypothetical protein
VLPGICSAGFRAPPLALLPTEQLAQRPGQFQSESLGALFYNIGIVATAVVLPLFFLGLSRWKTANNRTQRLMLSITQDFGILCAFAMLMSGLYPISSPALHSFFSICLYILPGTAFAFAVAALLLYAARSSRSTRNRLMPASNDRYRLMLFISSP